MIHKSEEIMNKYQGDALHTDLYQINMGYAYFKDGIHERKSYFDVYFRKIPFGGGYAVFAGLAKIIDYVNSFKFTESDIEFLRKLGYEEEYLKEGESLPNSCLRSYTSGDWNRMWLEPYRKKQIDISPKYWKNNHLYINIEVIIIIFIIIYSRNYGY